LKKFIGKWFAAFLIAWIKKKVKAALLFFGLFVGIFMGFSVYIQLINHHNLPSFSTA